MESTAYNTDCMEIFKPSKDNENYLVSNQLIAKCCKGERKHHKGYEWKYE